MGKICFPVIYHLIFLLLIFMVDNPNVYVEMIIKYD